MAVEVDHVLDGLALREVEDDLLDLHDFWRELLTLSLGYFDSVLAPVPVQIQAGHVAARHAVNNAVRVDHRDDYELELRK